jgi:hypothetical protein
MSPGWNALPSTRLTRVEAESALRARPSRKASAGAATRSTSEANCRLHACRAPGSDRGAARAPPTSDLSGRGRFDSAHGPLPGEGLVHARK